MSILIIPVWTGADGQPTSPIYAPVRTQDAAAPLISRAMQAAARDHATDLRMLVVDDLTGHTIARIRPRTRAAA